MLNNSKALTIMVDFIAKNYSFKTDLPCLYEQFNEFEIKRPFSGLKILNGTPLFKTTIPKLLPIVAAGADLTIIPTPSLPYDQSVFDFFQSLGVRITNELSNDLEFDVVLDCIGSFSKTKSTYGYVELTRSGESYYLDSRKPCIFIDQSKIKLIEDSLGTADGLVRVFDDLKISLKDKKIVLFGFGKVGKGAYLKLKDFSRNIVIVEKSNQLLSSKNVNIIDFNNKSEVENLLLESEIVITATGVKNALADVNGKFFRNNNKVLVNIGAEDEFGPHINSNEVINNKKPANFILDVPTKLKYLDATFALQNYSAVDLLNEKLQPGINPPLIVTENRLVNTIKLKSDIWSEICGLNLI